MGNRHRCAEMSKIRGAFAFCWALLCLQAHVFPCLAAEDDGTVSAHQKLSQLVQLSAESKTNVISLTLNDYRNYVLKNPRPYHMFLLFSGDGSFCADCPKIERAYEAVALSYRESGEFKPSGGKMPVFFGHVDAVANTQIAMLHDIKTIPHLFNTEPKSLKKAPNGPALLFKQKDTFRFPKADVDARDILNFVNDKTMRHVELYQSFGQRVGNILLFLALVVVALLIVAVGVYLVNKFPVLIIIVALGIQYVSTCGLFYNLQHGMQLFGVDQRGQPVTFAKSNRAQYLAEGLFMAGCMIVGAMSLVGAVLLPGLEFIKKKKMSNVVSTVMFGLFIVMAYMVLDIYKWKTGWYAPTFYPTEDAVRGPLRVDRGNSF
eukprot:GDKI01039144.1.p1 GENE.GDKI01039144.1~~GDKI01039144.1.p1  ORF type:complete len:375 (+),score=103.97 GDKI01039144.1:1-1125(+)